MPEFRGIAHVELTVRDLDRSAAWYERVLCMTRLGEFPDLATPGVAARVEHVMNTATGITLGLMQHADVEDGDFSEFHVGLDHLSLRVTSREELEEWVAHLDRCEVPHSGIHDMTYGSVVVFRDPDNIQLELFALLSDFRIDIDSPSSAD
jgi:catechol 2,3-dioxygenase-like lactoylglutathione lyase family enzyme